MGKSIPGFILGVIGGILATITGLLAVLATEIVNAMVGLEVIMIYVTSWAMFVGGIIAIIGASLALSKSKKAGITMIVSAILLAIGFYNGFSVWTLIMTGLTLAGGIIAVANKTTTIEKTA
jgi:hypothetical protein